jgi:hypothetical protein
MNPPEFARHWAQELGSSDENIIQMKGGINNHVFRCSSRDMSWVIKGYPPDQQNQRDRMQAEIEFLQYANLVAPEKVPELIAVDHERRCVVLEHLEGETFREGIPPPQGAVSFAVDFFRQLNADHGTANKIVTMAAAESFLNITEHLDNIGKRLEKMDCMGLPNELQIQASHLLRAITRRYEYIQVITEDKISRGEILDAIRPEERCISPSDFGFHNAIWTREGVKFIDFEFSGWDDPAKAMLDFILQPRVPIYQEPSPLRATADGKETILLDRRYDALRPILSLKWLCIILSVLSKERLEQISRLRPDQEAMSLICQRVKLAISYGQKTSSLSSLGLN